MAKVALIGLDGADPDLIVRWRGYLPNLSRLMRCGSYGKLRSSIPPLTVPAWNCIYTGKNPGKLGVYDFAYRERGSYRIKIVDSSMVAGENVWEILSRKSKRVAVANAPLTYPAKPVNGIMVSGLPLPISDGRPTRTYTHPPEFSAELDEKVGGYTFSVPFDIPADMTAREVAWQGGAIRRESTMQQGSVEKKQIDAAKYVLTKEDWDFYTVVLREIDLVSHFAWKHHDKSEAHRRGKISEEGDNPLLNAYITADKTVGEIVSMLDKDTVVFVVSDHGNGPLYLRFYLNEFLRRLGLLSLRKTTLWRLNAGSRFKAAALWALRQLIRIDGAGLAKRIPRRLGKAARLVDQFEGNVERIDWSRTKAYSFGEIGRIFINVKGREPQGIVEPGEEYEKLRDFIIERLNELTDPATGKKFLDRVFKGEEIYRGEFAGEAPDILFYMDGLRCIASTRLGHRLLFDEEDLTSGTHRPYGIFMAYGSGIRKGASVRLDICDVAPTILHIMGLPVPDDMDGRPALGILEPGSEAARRPVTYEKTTSTLGKTFEWSADEEKKLEEQLRGLGYLG
jgi:predicted AlkP superfamily phosphohydrolase/phosphomutase